MWVARLESTGPERPFLFVFPTNECEGAFTLRFGATKEFFTIPKMFINNVFSNTKDSIISKFYLYLDPTNVKGFYQYQRMFCNADMFHTDQGNC